MSKGGPPYIAGVPDHMTAIYEGIYYGAAKFKRFSRAVSAFGRLNIASSKSIRL
jgi:hypothetical protein